MYNYANLTDNEFEELCKDILEVSLGTKLHTYTKGRDQGIDICDNPYTKGSNSSLLSRQAVGDIISVDKKADSVQQHEKINVNLQITKIFKHISNFDFEID